MEKDGKRGPAVTVSHILLRSLFPRLRLNDDAAPAINLLSSQCTMERVCRRPRLVKRNCLPFPVVAAMLLPQSIAHCRPAGKIPSSLFSAGKSNSTQYVLVIQTNITIEHSTK